MRRKLSIPTLGIYFLFKVESACLQFMNNMLPNNWFPFFCVGLKRSLDAVIIYGSGSGSYLHNLSSSTV